MSDWPGAPPVTPVFSVDDHVIEPPDAFAGRLPARLRHLTPRVVEADEALLRSMLGDNFEKWDPARNPVVAHGSGSEAPRQAWKIGDRHFPLYGMDSCVGRPPASWSMRPLRFDEMIPGSWDADARVADMDRAGIYASVNFPSMWVGFCGTTFFTLEDRALGEALVRAWNDWHLEAWAGAHPGRFVPLQLPMLWDAHQAAAEVEANAAKGFRAVSFSENPTGQGLPSIHSGYWDPFFAACEATATVVCLHAGSSGHTLDTSTDAPLEVAQSLFPVGSAMTAVDWLWSRIPVRFPALRIALSEGGIGWLPVVADWTDHTMATHQPWTGVWSGVDQLPSEVLLRNFWFCTIDEPRSLPAVADTVGLGHVTLEVDYPHADSTWPDTQQRVAGYRLRPEDRQAVAYGNACDLFAVARPGATGGGR